MADTGFDYILDMIFEGAVLRTLEASVNVEHTVLQHVEGSLDLIANKKVTLTGSVNVKVENKVYLDASVDVRANGRLTLVGSVNVRSRGLATLEASVNVERENVKRLTGSVNVEYSNTTYVDAEINVARQVTKTFVGSVDVEQDNTRRLIGSVNVEHENRRYITGSVDVEYEDYVNIEGSVYVSPLYSTTHYVTATILVQLTIDDEDFTQIMKEIGSDEIQWLPLGTLSYLDIWGIFQTIGVNQEFNTVNALNEYDAVLYVMPNTQVDYHDKILYEEVMYNVVYIDAPEIAEHTHHILCGLKRLPSYEMGVLVTKNGGV